MQPYTELTSFMVCSKIDVTKLDDPLPTLPHNNHNTSMLESDMIEPSEYIDDDWVGYTMYMGSILDVGIFFASAPIQYSVWFQITISLSSAKLEFVTASEATKLTIYIYIYIISILNNHHIPQLQQYMTIILQ